MNYLKEVVVQGHHRRVDRGGGAVEVHYCVCGTVNGDVIVCGL